MVNVKDFQNTYLVDVNKYHAQPKLVKNFKWSLSPNYLPSIQDHQVGIPHSDYQITCNMSDPAAKP